MTDSTPFPQRIRTDFRPRDKAHLLSLIAAEAAEATGQDAALILTALKRREDLGSTGVGNGIALPHAGVPGLAAPFGLFCRLSPPIGYDAVDDKPVDLVFVLLTPAGDRKGDLTALSTIARRLRSKSVVATLRQAASEEDLREALNAPV
jgi:PTS system nitrogen regulatory IIA component